MKFSDRVHYLRIKSGYTQVELAEKVGISQPAIQALESGRAQPKGSTVVSLAAALNVTAEELMRGDENDRCSERP